jgi:hypothetical protein
MRPPRASEFKQLCCALELALCCTVAVRTGLACVKSSNVNCGSATHCKLPHYNLPLALKFRCLSISRSSAGSTHSDVTVLHCV